MSVAKRITSALISFLVIQSSFAQKNFQRFSSLHALTHAPLQKGQLCALPDKLYDGGIFEVKEKNNYVVDSGIVFPTANPALVLVRQMKDARTVQMKWFGVNDSINNFMPAFKKATAYLNTKGGGTILFDAGTFFADPFFTIDANNITVKGMGKNKTFIKVSGKAGAGLMVNSNYRDAGWRTNAEDLITYKDNSVVAGSKYVDLKIKTDEKNLLPGAIIFINGGANYFDQHYGEFNMIDHCKNGRAYLKYPLSRSYEQGVSSWAATLTADFNPPAENATATIQYNGTQPRGGTVISIGNDLYKVVSVTAAAAIVSNIKNKGNSKLVIKAGTHIYRYRAIALTPSVVQNVHVEGMTITGKRKAITVSNTFTTSFKNVRFNWMPQPASPGGIWLDGDDGRDFRMEDCEVNCIYLYRAQFARSFADIYISNTRFNQAGIQFTEYNINANVTNCLFNLKRNYVDGEETAPIILLGNTCNAINFSNNNINAENISQVFSSSEIQGTKAKVFSAIHINNNTITCNNVGTLFSGAYYGNAEVSDNKISGSVNILFSLHSVKNNCVVKKNLFTGYVDGFAAAAANAQYINNTVTRLGASSKPVEYNSWGNVLYTHIAPDTSVQSFVFKNNNFTNWNLLRNSFSHYWPLNDKVDISNNHFYKSPKDTVVTLH